MDRLSPCHQVAQALIKGDAQRIAKAAPGCGPGADGAGVWPPRLDIVGQVNDSVKEAHAWTTGGVDGDCVQHGRIIKARLARQPSRSNGPMQECHWGTLFETRHNYTKVGCHFQQLASFEAARGVVDEPCQAGTLGIGAVTLSEFDRRGGDRLRMREPVWRQLAS